MPAASIVMEVNWAVPKENQLQYANYWQTCFSLSVLTQEEVDNNKKSVSAFCFLQILQTVWWNQEAKSGAHSGETDHHDNRRSGGRRSEWETIKKMETGKFAT